MSTTKSPVVTIICAACRARGESELAMAEACDLTRSEVPRCPMREHARRRHVFRQLREGDPISPYDGSPV